MSSELLRGAAALMRERAEAATPSPWGFGGAGVGTDYWDGRDERPIAKTDWTAERGLTRDEMAANKGNGEHIASWHPDVALAVADMLDRAADEWDQEPSTCASYYGEAIDAARAYIGRNE